MSDLISRQAAIDAINRICPVDTEYDCTLLDRVDVRCVLADLPSAQPEIIKCRDCKYYEWMSNRVPDEQTWFCHNWNVETGKGDFCSRAERREE